MKHSIRILAKGQADINRILRWLDTRSMQGADAWYISLFEQLEAISDDARSFPTLSESLRSKRTQEIRQALFKTRRGRRYRVIFEVTETEARILRVRGPGQPPIRKRDLPSG